VIDDDSDSDSSSSSNSSSENSMVMQIEDPPIEINEFSVMNQIGKKKIIPTKQVSIRKRSYSKEDVKIGLSAQLDTGTLSPEFVISDEDEYRADKESEVENTQENLGEGMNSATYGRSLTVPST